MKKLFQLIKVVLLLLITFQTNGQVIPSEWEGTWSGTVNIWSYNKKTDSFPMSLEITPKDSVWNFVIFYKKDPNKPDKRQYELIIIDPSKYHLAIDEKNSIILDSYFNDNCLYTIFGGMGSDLQTRICMNKETLEYEITSSLSQPIRISGNEVIANDTIPEISSYNLYHIMKAKLKKEKRE